VRFRFEQSHRGNEKASDTIGVGQLAEISELAEKGVAIALVAPLPDAIQNVTAYYAAVTAASREPEAARELARFLGALEARAVFAATGID